MHTVNNSPYRLLLIVAVLAIFADALLRATPWGANLFVAVLGALAAARLLCRWNNTAMTGEGRWLVPAMLFFVAALVWRDSPTLTTANAAALVAATTLAALSARAGQVRLAGVSLYVVGMLYMLGFALAGLFPVLFREIPWRQVGHRGWAAPALATGRGLLVAVPPLLIFGSLFAAADANFQRLLDDTFKLDVDEVVTRIALVLAYAWLAGGTLREMLVAPDRPRPWSDPPRRLTIGTIELTVVLGLLDLLFLSFVVLQLPYLFGGREQVSSLGYSDYARRGFFELVWVTGLTLPLLLFMHWLVPKTRPLAGRVYGVLALVLVILLAVIVVSAVQRMQLYVVDNGLTELRVQSSAFMLWVSIVLVWFVATVLRGQRARFAFGALLSAWLVIAGLDVLNPDALIVRTNAAQGHLLDNGRFDRLAVASLSADATPAIVDALPQLPERDRALIAERLGKRFPEPSDDWRTFNWSRSQAQAAVASLAH
jgi:hypothetical protein